MRGRAFAFANLGWRFARHLAWLPVRAVRRRSGADTFLASVAPEGYLPLTPEERSWFPARMRCVSCGLCALASPAAASAWDDAWSFVAGASRSIDAAGAAASGAGAAAQDAAAESVCPTGVPIRALAESLRRLAAAGERPT
jgi:ferredoxin